MKEQIMIALSDFKFTQVGFLNLTKPISLSFYEEWLDEGLNADMKYLKDHLGQKKDLNQFLPEAKSVIIVALDYFNHPKPMSLKSKKELITESLLTKTSDTKISSMKIASYAKGEDYHFFFKKKLEDAKNHLKSIYPNEEFKTSTDSKPILERDFAYQAGLGWYGKNTMLIHQDHGSYFLLGEIVTTIDFKSTKKENLNFSIDVNPSRRENADPMSDDLSYHPNRCGTCTKCIDACPTQALSPQKLDANKCISYWTIESKTIPPLSLAQKFDSWFFGCDICQDVCPWNIKLHTLDKIKTKNQVERQDVLDEILEILKSSNKALEKKFFGTPLSRARGFGLKRNALIVAMNMKAIEIKDDITNIDLKNLELENFKTKILSSLTTFNVESDLILPQ